MNFSGSKYFCFGMNVTVLDLNKSVFLPSDSFLVYELKSEPFSSISMHFQLNEN